MDIDRRKLLGAMARVSLTGFVGGYGTGSLAGGSEVPLTQRWHPLTRSLLDRASRAGDRFDRPRIQRTIHELAAARGLVSRPVIKWMEDPTGAFDRLSRYGLDALLRMGTASFWHLVWPAIPVDEEAFDRSFDLRCLAAELFRVEDHDRALMGPKLLAKSEATSRNANVEASFEVRAVAAQIGWLETSMPAAAAEAVVCVELLLSSGFSEHDELIHHQLRVLEAYEHGLLATWEMPAELICVPRVAVA
jgi:hypothetical protein